MMLAQMKSFLVILFLIFCSSTYLNAQTFEEWKKQQQEEFQAYKDKFDEEFIKMLKNTWEEVGISSGAGFYSEIKPEVVPVYTAPERTEMEIPEDVLIDEKITIDLGFDLDTSPFELPTPNPNIELERERESDLAFDLFGETDVQRFELNYFSNSIPFSYPTMISRKLNPTYYRNGKLDNDRIARFWEEVSSVNHTEFVKYTLDLKEELALNDWGYILLINSISKDIIGAQHPNLVRLMNWFLLTKAGYKTKVGYDQNRVYNLFAVNGNIFDQKYYILDGEKYFPLNYNDEFQNPGSIFTYTGGHEAQVRKLDFSIYEYPTITDQSESFQKTLRFEFKDRRYEFPVSVSSELISYFEFYPRTDLPVFFSASMSEPTKKQLYTQLEPILESMNELQAVNFLLRLVQTSFEYKTDQEQFDREKYMLPDEIFYYSYSDCDDRAIFFATLVQDLLGLDVVALRYSRHLATAVKFSHNVPGDFHVSNGQKYVVADPTYVNAPVGLTMTSYRNERPEIIRF